MDEDHRKTWSVYLSLKYVFVAALAFVEVQ